MNNVCTFCNDPATSTTGEIWICPSCYEVYKAGVKYGSELSASLNTQSYRVGYSEGRADEKILQEARK